MCFLSLQERWSHRVVVHALVRVLPELHDVVKGGGGGGSVEEVAVYCTPSGHDRPLGVSGSCREDASASRRAADADP